jgi:adenylylsulfate kinase
MSWAIWITGPPGSGKSSLARAAAAAVGARGEPVRVLELDEIRKTITPVPRYTDAERDIVYRALGYMALLVTEAGTGVIIDATAHRRAWRELARQTIPRFAEVQVVCPAEVCRERERARSGGHAPTGIYARAGQPGATVPGADLPYELALSPELVVDSVAEPLPLSAARVAELAERLALRSEPAVRATSPSWAIWITGRPGSGKSTLAERVAASLTSRDIAVRVLDYRSVERRLLPDRPGSEPDHETVHRALAYAAKLLTEVGVPVIVDATAPRRVWRETARALIGCFAEVQLACSAEVCVERERAARWGLGGESPPEARRPAPTPDVALGYEESLRPDLIVHTDVHDPWTTAEQVLFLAHRLHRMVSPSSEAS